MLTDVEASAAKAGIKDYKLADAHGLYLFVTRAGFKSWRMKYRYGGKEKRLTFGAYPEVSLDEARQRRDDARQLLRDNIDPGMEKQRTRAAGMAAGDDGVLPLTAGSAIARDLLDDMPPPAITRDHPEEVVGERSALDDVAEPGPIAYSEAVPDGDGMAETPGEPEVPSAPMTPLEIFERPAVAANRGAPPPIPPAPIGERLPPPRPPIASRAEAWPQARPAFPSPSSAERTDPPPPPVEREAVRPPMSLEPEIAVVAPVPEAKRAAVTPPPEPVKVAPPFVPPVIIPDDPVSTASTAEAAPAPPASASGSEETAVPVPGSRALSLLKDAERAAESAASDHRSARRIALLALGAFALLAIALLWWMNTGRTAPVEAVAAMPSAAAPMVVPAASVAPPPAATVPVTPTPAVPVVSPVAPATSAVAPVPAPAASGASSHASMVRPADAAGTGRAAAPSRHKHRRHRRHHRHRGRHGHAAVSPSATSPTSTVRSAGRAATNARAKAQASRRTSSPALAGSSSAQENRNVIIVGASRGEAIDPVLDRVGRSALCLRAAYSALPSCAAVR